MKTTLLPFIFFVCCLFSNTLEAQTKEKEPNNTPETANLISLDETVSGKIDPAGEADWFKVKTTADGQLTVNLTPLSGIRMNIELFDTAGVISLNSQTYINTSFDLVTDGLAAGTYFIKINCYYATDTSSYTIKPTFLSPSVANDKEPNNTPSTAVTIAENKTNTGLIGYYYNNRRDTSDWYKITTTNDGRLDLTLQSENGNRLSIYLYDADGTTLISSQTYIMDSYTHSTDGLAAGTYYVKIISYYNYQFTPYTFSDSLFLPAQKNDKEPNNDPSTAVTLSVNSTVTGHIGYYNNNKRDTSDWYKVTTANDGRLDLTLRSDNGNRISIYLYDADGTTLISSQTYIMDSYTHSTDGLAAGAYYVKIISYYNYQFAPYTLTDSLKMPVQANDKEPNNDPLTAVPLSVNSTVTGHIGYYNNLRRDTTDWYKIILPTDGQLDLTLTSNNGNRVSIYLYDADASTLISSQTYIMDSYTHRTDGLAAGAYYVKIISYYNYQFAPYTLIDSLKQYEFVADTLAEPNNAAYQAKTLLANRNTNGHIGFYNNLRRDTTDWWKINYTGSGDLSITISMEPNINNNTISRYSYAIYQDTNANPISSDTYINLPSNEINLSGLSQQYYYVKIYMYYNYQFQAYSISDTFTQVNIAKIAVNTGKTILNSPTCGGNSITYDLSGSRSPYMVRLYKNNKLYDSTLATTSTAAFTGLSAGEYYATSYGDGGTDLAFGKSATSTVVPPTPISLNTSNIGVHTATLNWTSISCAKYYKVQYRAVGSQSWTIINTTGNTAQVQLSALIPYTTYSWQVATVDTLDKLTFTSAFADSITFKTLSDTAHIDLIYSAVGEGCNNDTLRFEATNSEAPYSVTLYRNGAVYNTLSVTDTASFYNIPPGQYYATATGTGSGGSLGTSETTSIAPPAPDDLDTTDVTSNSILLNWEAVSCATSYTVQYKITGTGTWTTMSAATNSLSLTGLLPDTLYTWEVSSSNAYNGITVVGQYSDTATFRTQSTLPVTFVSFNGKIEGSKALLTWSTSSEVNNDGYDVEKSYDGINFFSIGFVEGADNSAILNNYSFIDFKVVNGSNFYRLKQIDNDGMFKYSATIKLDYLTFSWSILGNPSNNNSWMQLNLDKPARVSFQIITMNGNVVRLVNQGNISSGSYSIPINLNGLPSGIYFIRLLIDNQIQTKKIIK